jgi:hypothetical protein
MENFALFYLTMGFITLIIGSYRAYKGKQSTEPDALDSVSWFLVWFLYLPIFCVRYIKYKLRGKSI